MSIGKRIAFFIPVYNEAGTLGKILAGLPKKLTVHGRTYDCDIFVVDDCSTDQSFGIARQYTPNVLQTGENSGVGQVTRIGLLAISHEIDKYDCVIKFDADGQHDLHLLPFVADALQHSDLVICSRFTKNSDQSFTPIDRLITNYVAALKVNKIIKRRLTDVRSGFMGIRSEFIPMLANNLVTERYGIPIEIILRIWQVKKSFRVKEIEHPAMYDRNISGKLHEKYMSEDLEKMLERETQASRTIYRVLEDMGVSHDEVIEAFGYSRPITRPRSKMPYHLSSGSQPLPAPWKVPKRFKSPR